MRRIGSLFGVLLPLLVSSLALGDYYEAIIIPSEARGGSSTTFFIDKKTHDIFLKLPRTSSEREGYSVVHSKDVYSTLSKYYTSLALEDKSKQDVRESTIRLRQGLIKAGLNLDSKDSFDNSITKEADDYVKSAYFKSSISEEFKAKETCSQQPSVSNDFETLTQKISPINGKLCSSLNQNQNTPNDFNKKVPDLAKNVKSSSTVRRPSLLKSIDALGASRTLTSNFSKVQPIKPEVGDLNLGGTVKFENQEITFNKKLGQGRDGDVWLVSSSTDSGKTYAAKMFKTDSSEGNNELAVLNKLGKSKYIVPSSSETLSLTSHGIEYTILLEDAAAGSLKDFAPKLNQTEPRTQLSIILDILEGYQFLHNKGFVQEDVHSGNILILKNGHAVLADFGTTRSVNQTNDKAQREENKVIGSLIKTLFSESILKRVAEELVSSGDIEAAISSIKEISRKVDLKLENANGSIIDDLDKKVSADSSSTIPKRPGLKRSSVTLGVTRATHIVKEVDEAPEVQSWSKGMGL